MRTPPPAVAKAVITISGSTRLEPIVEQLMWKLDAAQHPTSPNERIARALALDAGYDWWHVSINMIGVEFIARFARIIPDSHYRDSPVIEAEAHSYTWTYEELNETNAPGLDLMRGGDWRADLGCSQTETTFLTLLQARADHLTQPTAPDPAEPEPGRKPGRPEVGPAIKVRLPADLLAAIDTHAARTYTTRAAIIRETLAASYSPDAN